MQYVVDPWISMPKDAKGLHHVKVKMEKTHERPTYWELLKDKNLLFCHLLNLRKHLRKLLYRPTCSFFFLLLDIGTELYEFTLNHPAILLSFYQLFCLFLCKSVRERMWVSKSATRHFHVKTWPQGMEN